MSQPSAHSFAATLALAARPAPLWHDDELGPILIHQLDAPMAVDLAGIAPDLTGRLHTLTSAEGQTLRSFADLLFHPHPPVELLTLIKDFAKTHLHQGHSPLPTPIVLLLYYASITAALLRSSRRISSLTDEQLLTGLQHLTALPWLDSRSRHLLEQGIHHLTPPPTTTAAPPQVEGP